MPAATPVGPAALDPGQLVRVRLVFSDLDETLLGPDHRVGERTQRAIAGLQAAGVEFVVCTGRAPEATWPIVRSLGGRYAICTNGAAVYDGQRVVAEQTLAPDLVGQMVAFFDREACPIYLMTPRGYLVTRITPAVEEANRARGVAPRLVDPVDCALPAHKVMPWGAAHLAPAARERWGHAAHVVYHPDYLEITPHGISKAWGARILAQRLGIAPDQVAAIGDAQNDLELITWAGIGVAMGNADPLLKAAADAVAGDYAADGAADLFEALLRARGLEP